MQAVTKSNKFTLTVPVLVLSENDCTDGQLENLPVYDLYMVMYLYWLSVFSNDFNARLSTLITRVENKTEGNITCMTGVAQASGYLPYIPDSSVALSEQNQTSYLMCILKSCYEGKMYRPYSLPNSLPIGCESAVSNCSSELRSNAIAIAMETVSLYTDDDENGLDCPNVELSMDELNSILLHDRNEHVFNDTIQSMNRTSS